ncbi:putative ankyrin repeat and sam domain containing protein 6 protein [Botrytis fragariae]|uniref:Putative ankyrin repeat and sam domain containing protein 6 protein n=1 Tax=Botrytis fragariae TaxID=1964551 RepID=A0A8H6EDJ1_9HELO|nr:putative ankyrin repeat and sam domain containing protein 6 protein [Botrytis fragariae]KAF5868158.1 putative ankyrin repeat and sam domain containing protein 6 protein [Botrytis fragariae]
MGIDDNYNAIVKEVYTGATTRILNQGSSLSLLNAAGIGRYRNDKQISINNDLPSWVPDFSHFPDSNLLFIPANLADCKMTEASEAKKSLIHINSTNPDRVSIQILGRSVSHATAIYPSRSMVVYKNNVGEFQVELKQRRDWIIETMNYASRLEPYLSDIPWHQAYSRPLVNNELPLRLHGMPVEPPYSEHLDVFLNFLKNIIEADAQEVREIEMAGGLIEAFEDNVEKVRKFALGVSFRGRMFETDNGYSGMGQEGMEMGDEVCLFYGGQTPYIVREVKEYQNKGWNQTSGHEFVLVEDCYIDGWMDGEAMEMGEEKKFMPV